MRVVFFNHLSHDQITDICNIRKEYHYDASESIIVQGEKVDKFIYFKDGLVKLYQDNEIGADQIINFASPLDFISISEFSTGEYQYSVSALVPSIVCIIEMDMIKSFATTNPAFTIDLMEKLSLTTDKILHEKLELKRLNLRGKLAMVLHMFSTDIFSSAVFELPVTRKEIAEYAGVSTENIIRGLSEFRKDKLIRISGKEIEILEPERLKRIANYG
ncbi:MAG: Crp/Fnr family transcriptional regulator [Bacteroidales bacterium]